METPSDAPLREAYPCTARPHRRPAEGDSKNSSPFWCYKQLQPSFPRHIFTLRPTPSHWEVRLPLGVFHEHLRRPSMVGYVILHKHLLTIPPTILVPKNFTWYNLGQLHIQRDNILIHGPVASKHSNRRSLLYASSMAYLGRTTGRHRHGVGYCHQKHR